MIQLFEKWGMALNIAWILNLSIYVIIYVVYTLSE